MKNFKTISILLMTLVLFTFSACIPKVSPNEHVVVTSNCWNTMTVIKAGEVPPRMITNCDRKCILPAYPMDGQVNIPSRFIGDVKGTVNLDYQYEIIDPKLFIQNAKFVVTSKTDDGSGSNKVSNDNIEYAENSVIDKKTRDIVREYIPTVNPVDIDEGDIENHILPLINEVMAERGIKLSSTSVDVDFKQQTEQALDVISAYNLYKNAGLENLGEQVIANQALKPEIRMQNSK